VLENDRAASPRRVGFALFAYDLDQHALAPPSIELAIKEFYAGKRPEGATIAAILKATRALGLHRCP